jgi:hypothetical protein
MKLMTIEDLREQNLILLEALSGSQAYGTAVASSDTDIKGIFYQPLDNYLGWDYQDEAGDEKQNVKFFELGKFLRLLAASNPGVLELLYTPPDCIIYRHPVLDLLSGVQVLSRKCRDTFGNYAAAQIKKARGLKKKIVNPVDLANKRSILDFCFVLKNQGGDREITLRQWLSANNYDQKLCAITKIDFMRDMYRFFYDFSGENDFKGLVRDESHTSLLLSSVPREAVPFTETGWLYYNEDGYKAYLRDYAEYKKWTEDRNEARYQETLAHGKGYDQKNMMHCFRLLEMAAEIALEGTIRVRRPNAAFLLSIRQGNQDYHNLLSQAQVKIDRLEQLYAESPLPDNPDYAGLENIQKIIRKELYGLSD